MAKACSVFWDMDIPKGETVVSIVNLIRSTIVTAYNLNEIFFYCVCDVNKLPANIGQSSSNLEIDIVLNYNEVEDSADVKILNLMKKFVKIAGQDCTIILLSDAADYYDTLNDLKRLYNVTIHLISLANTFSPKLDQISDYTYLLNDGILKAVKSNDLPMHFILIRNYDLSSNTIQVIDQLNSQITESIQKSAILFDESICIGFATLQNAEKAIERLNETWCDGNTQIDLIINSPLSEILKYMKPYDSDLTQNRDDVKQLTFIKLDNSKESVDKCKIIEFCIACTVQSDSQCILSTKQFLWIVFSCRSDALKFLTKVKIIYPDAVISEPPIDLIYTCDKDSYTVVACEQKGTKGKLQSVDDENDLRIFFQYDSKFVAPILYHQPTKWSLLYNLFEKLYDLRAKKVIFDGHLYCIHFDSVSDYQNALATMHSLHLEPLEYVIARETQNQKVSKKLNRYVTGIPWCLTQELDLCCLAVKIDSKFHEHFMEISKKVLGNRECIFIKSIPGEIWIGFPDEFVCENSEKTVKDFLTSLGNLNNDIYCVKPSNELLESIGYQNLVGEAYDLAFLSSQLEILKPITRPSIIKRISLQRMEEKKCIESFFGVRFDLKSNQDSWPTLRLGQIVKILVNFSKVIPLGVSVSHHSHFTFRLMYSSWHEAHVACHFLKNLRSTELPYFKEFYPGNGVFRISCTESHSFYFINDKRKVLEKILQHKSLVNRLDPNSLSVQSTSDIDVKDEETMKKLQFLFVITTDSEFGFTPGMISIIKMHLVQMDCPVCIEYEDKIWFEVEDLEKGNKAKAKIEQIMFNVLDENDDDFMVKVEVQSVKSIPTNAANILLNKLINSSKILSKNGFEYLNSKVVPLGHFNYNYRKAVGMSFSRYCQLNELVSS